METKNYQSVLILTAVENNENSCKLLKQAKKDILSILGSLYYREADVENMLCFDRALNKQELQWLHATYNADLTVSRTMVTHMLVEENDIELTDGCICLTGRVVLTSKYKL